MELNSELQNLADKLMQAWKIAYDLKGHCDVNSTLSAIEEAQSEFSKKFGPEISPFKKEEKNPPFVSSMIYKRTISRKERKLPYDALLKGGKGNDKT